MNHLSREELYSVINQLKREINRLSTDLIKTKIISNEFQKYFEYFHEMNEKITSNKQILDLIKRLKVLKYFNEELCFVSVIPLDKNHFKRTKLISKTKVENSLNKLNANTVSSNETFNPQILKNEIQSEDIEEEVQNESEIKSLKTSPLPISSESEDNGSTFGVIEDPKSDTSDEEWNENEKSVDSKPRVLKCNFEGCSATFKFAHTLRRHKAQHTGEFRCDLNGCQFKAGSEYHLQRHTLQRHSNERAFKCFHKSCEKSFKTEEKLRKHQISHQTLDHCCEVDNCDTKVDIKQEFKCSFEGCSASFKYRRTFKQHTAQHTAEYNCDLKGCLFKAGSKYYLQKHKIRHSKESAFMCCHKSCENRFKTLEMLSEHQISHQTEDHCCELNDCGFKLDPSFNTYISKRTWSRRKPFAYRPPKKYICDFIGCGKEFKKSSHFKRHKDMHLGIRYNCEQDGCTRVFTTKKALKVHTLRHKGFCDFKGCSFRGQSLFDLMKHKRTHSLQQSLKCLITDCNKEFDTEKKVKNHQLREHPLEFEDMPWIQCDRSDCDFKTKVRDDIIRHKSHHLIHTCDACGKEFNRAGTLNIHKSVHSEPLACDWPGCGKVFTRRERLRGHMNGHTGATIYRCDWPGCDKTFSVPNSYNIHRYRHKARRSFECNLCSFRSVTAPTYKNHMKTHETQSEEQQN